MTPTYARNEQQQRQQEWLAGTRRVYADEVDYGGRARAQTGSGRSGRTVSDAKAGDARWKENGPRLRAMA